MKYQIKDIALHDPNLTNGEWDTAQEAIEHLTPTMDLEWPNLWFIRKNANIWRLGCYNGLDTDSWGDIAIIQPIASTQEVPPTGWNQNLPRRYPETKQEAQSPPKGYSFEEQMRWYPDPPPQDEEEDEYEGMIQLPPPQPPNQEWVEQCREEDEGDWRDLDELNAWHGDEKRGNQSVPLASDVAQDALDGSGAVLPPQQQEKCLLWGTMRQAVSWELAQENGAPGL